MWRWRRGRPLGASLFLLQVLSRIALRAQLRSAAAAVIVLFSGCDIIGNLLRVPHFIPHWDITQHLEWWAGRYQYSSMTTQLFWVPNHALGGWLLDRTAVTRGARHVARIPAADRRRRRSRSGHRLRRSASSPSCFGSGSREGASTRGSFSTPAYGQPALAVGLAVAAYLTLDAGRIPKGWTVGTGGAGTAAIATDLSRQAAFFLLEAGFIGFAILAIRRSSAVVLALVILALLPLGKFGAANDLVMRASIPSLAVLAIGAACALTTGASDASRLAQESASRFSAGGGCSDADPGVRACRDAAFLADQPAGDVDRRVVRPIFSRLRGGAPSSSRSAHPATAATAAAGRAAVQELGVLSWAPTGRAGSHRRTARSSGRHAGRRAAAASRVSRRGRP